MRGYMPTTSKMHGALAATLGICTIGATAFIASDAAAQGNAILEEITVTAQRREERLRDVPISVTALSGERLDALFEGGEDIRALAARVPSLYAESSNGRLAPRFYMRGLGNTDFDLAASQSVSIVVDEVVQENVILKSFPIFDLDRIEVLRGPQGTLFGRNTPAGIVKLETRKPTAELDGYALGTVGSAGTINGELAIGGPLNKSQSMMGRFSILSQNRQDYITNDFTGENNAMGGFNELAWRAQLLFEPNDDVSVLLNIHSRELSGGTASIFRANILTTGSNELNANFDRNTVFFDEGDNNPQEADAIGTSLRLDFGLGETVTLTSITAFENVDNRSLGDIDGGFGASFLPIMGPGFIPFPSVTQDGLDNLDQFTQEFRLASDGSSRLFWQTGLFLFDSTFEVTTNPFFVPATTLQHDNDAWAVFGQVSYDIGDRTKITAGLRYTDDEKRMRALAANQPVIPVQVQDDNVSWDLSLSYEINDDMNIYGRLASGFRAPTIQGRDVAFGAPPSTATSETINSVEAGFKSTLAGNRLRLNGAVYYYEINDQQLTAIGGTGNFVQLINADKGTGSGFDLDTEFLFTDNVSATLGLSYNKTSIDDPNLRIPICGSGQCTPLDQTEVVDSGGTPTTVAIVNGNSFPQSPETIANFTFRWGIPVSSGEWFFYTDWAYQSDTHFFLYESAEYHSGDIYEGGLRAGFVTADNRLEIAVFGRNITDEQNLKGGIDFNNNTGFVNDRRIWGVTGRVSFAGM